MTNLEVKLCRIVIYPIKGLDGWDVGQAVVTAAGPLAGDRALTVRQGDGRFLCGKTCPRLHRLRTTYRVDCDGRTVVQFQVDRMVAETFLLAEPFTDLERWLSDWLGEGVRIERGPAAGFPDDLDNPGPTLVSLASLQRVAQWFPGTAADGMRRRFRANLEIEGVPPFWEDALCGEPGVGREFQVGGARLVGTNPCQRCVVPTRDPDSGEAWPGFAKRFGERRAAELPPTASRDQFDHFYRLTVNTQPKGPDCTIAVGDLISVGGWQPASGWLHQGGVS